MTGHSFTFGDINVICGQIVRRTNDTLPVGAFMGVSYNSCVLFDQAADVLDDFWSILKESAAVAFAQQGLEPAFFKVLDPPEVKQLGNTFTPKHAAALYLAAVGQAQQ